MPYIIWQPEKACYHIKKKSYFGAQVAGFTELHSSEDKSPSSFSDSELSSELMLPDLEAKQASNFFKCSIYSRVQF